MSEPQRPTCATCAFWADYRPMSDTGFCQRHPPVVFRNEKVGSTSYFPEVDADEWCGEHPRMAAYIAALAAVIVTDSPRTGTP